MTLVVSSSIPDYPAFRRQVEDCLNAGTYLCTDIATKLGIAPTNVNVRLKKTGVCLRDLQIKFKAKHVQETLTKVISIIKERTRDIPIDILAQINQLAEENSTESKKDDFKNICRIVYLESLKGTGWYKIPKKHDFGRPSVINAYDLVVELVIESRKKIATEILSIIPQGLLSEQQRQVFQYGLCEWKHSAEIAKILSIEVHNVDSTYQSLVKMFPEIKGVLVRLKERDNARFRRKDEIEGEKHDLEEQIASASDGLNTTEASVLRSRTLCSPGQVLRKAELVKKASEPLSEALEVYELRSEYKNNAREACLKVDGFLENPSVAVRAIKEVSEILDRVSDQYGLEEKFRKSLFKRLANTRFISVSEKGYRLAYSAIEQRILDVIHRKELVTRVLNTELPPSNMYSKVIDKLIFISSEEEKDPTKKTLEFIAEYKKQKQILIDNKHPDIIAGYLAAEMACAPKHANSLSDCWKKIVEKCYRKEIIDQRLKALERTLTPERLSLIINSNEPHVKRAFAEQLASLSYSRFDLKSTKQALLSDFEQLLNPQILNLVQGKHLVVNFLVYALVYAKASRASHLSTKFLSGSESFSTQNKKDYKMKANVYRIRTLEERNVPEEARQVVDNFKQYLEAWFLTKKESNTCYASLLPLVVKVCSYSKKEELVLETYQKALFETVLSDYNRGKKLGLSDDQLKALSRYSPDAIESFVNVYGEKLFTQSIESGIVWLHQHALNRRRIIQYYNAVMFSGEATLMSKSTAHIRKITLTDEKPFGIAPEKLKFYRDIYTFLEKDYHKSPPHVRDVISSFVAISSKGTANTDLSVTLLNNYQETLKVLSKQDLPKIPNVIRDYFALQNMVYDSQSLKKSGILERQVGKFLKLVDENKDFGPVAMYLCSRCCYQDGREIKPIEIASNLVTLFSPYTEPQESLGLKREGVIRSIKAIHGFLISDSSDRKYQIVLNYLDGLIEYNNPELLGIIADFRNLDFDQK